MNRNQKYLTLSLSTLALVGAGVLGVSAWSAKVKARQEQSALVRAESLLKDGKAAEALVLVEDFSKKSSLQAWPKIELAALSEAQDIPRLALIFERTPARILADEAASVLVARAFLHARKPAEFARVREAWRGREHQLESWLALDSDTLLLAGKKREAERLLRAQTLPGAADATRLTRLAMVTAGTDLPGAWNLLCRAAAIQPRNPDVRSFKAQFLETAGRIELARVEYVAALVAAPRNVLLRDQLADFYQRNHNPDLALDTWTEALTLPTLDFIWLKAHFWSRVLRPVVFSSFGEVTAGELEPLVRQIAALKSGHFFDATAFEQLTRARRYTTQRQEVFWLRLLDTLQAGREAEALKLLAFEPPRLRSWEPDLASALHRILYYRQKQSLNPPGFTFASSVPETNRHPLFVLLDNAARQERASHDTRAVLTADQVALLRGPNVFSAALLAAGWREAALQMRPKSQMISSEPEWLSYGFAQALRINRNPRTAMKFLGDGQLNPALALLRAELYVETGRLREGREELTLLAPLNSSVGFRAAYLLALDAAANHHLNTARQYIIRQPLLACDDAGKELLARLSLMEGSTNEAEQIYRTIASSSVEAKTWLAKQAYSQRRWKEARQFTNELLDLIPDSPQLRENLLAIDQAEGRR